MKFNSFKEIKKRDILPYASASPSSSLIREGNRFYYNNSINSPSSFPTEYIDNLRERVGREMHRGVVRDLSRKYKEVISHTRRLINGEVKGFWYPENKTSEVYQIIKDNKGKSIPFIASKIRQILK